MLANLALVAQIVGVLGLIASLLYVGKQVQLNREQLQSDAEGRYYLWIDQVFSRIALDREFAEVWNRGSRQLDDMNAIDRERVVNHEIGALYMWQQFHLMMKRGMLDPHVEDALDWALKGVGNRPAMREAWKAAKPAFSKSFQQRCSQFLE
jgi:hypothetical protein